jgi:hypothetical protein
MMTEKEILQGKVEKSCLRLENYKGALLDAECALLEATCQQRIAQNLKDRRNWDYGRAQMEHSYNVSELEKLVSEEREAAWREEVKQQRIHLTQALPTES